MRPYPEKRSPRALGSDRHSTALDLVLRHDEKDLKDLARIEREQEDRVSLRNKTKKRPRVPSMRQIYVVSRKWDGVIVVVARANVGC
jgi:hypothetical protein